MPRQFNNDGPSRLQRDARSYGPVSGAHVQHFPAAFPAKQALGIRCENVRCTSRTWTVSVGSQLLRLAFTQSRASDSRIPDVPMPHAPSLHEALLHAVADCHKMAAPPALVEICPLSNWQYWLRALKLSVSAGQLCPENERILLGVASQDSSGDRTSVERYRST